MKQIELKTSNPALRPLRHSKLHCLPQSVNIIYPRLLCPSLRANILKDPVQLILQSFDLTLLIEESLESHLSETKVDSLKFDRIAALRSIQRHISRAEIVRVLAMKPGWDANLQIPDARYLAWRKMEKE